jgi:ATP-binding cassette, sub-family E, member 1
MLSSTCAASAHPIWHRHQVPRTYAPVQYVVIQNQHKLAPRAAGFIPSENMRFREEELNFKVSDAADEMKRKNERSYEYPAMVKRQGNFTLEVESGAFNDSEILVMLGENGTGKTTFIRMLAGVTAPDGFPGGHDDTDIPRFNVSYKPQKISPKFESTVRNLLHSKIRDAYLHPQFKSDVMTPLRIEALMDQEVQHLSGGELQRVAIALCLGKPADLYLIDEPSAYLDSEQRIIASKVIKRFIMHSKKTAFIVEHDFIMSAYLADRVVVYTARVFVLRACTELHDLSSAVYGYQDHVAVHASAHAACTNEHRGVCKLCAPL